MEVVEKLPMIQKFLAFLSNAKNVVALLLLLLLLSIAGNVYLVKKVLEGDEETKAQANKSLDYERERAKSYEDIVKELVRPKSHEKDSIH